MKKSIVLGTVNSGIALVLLLKNIKRYPALVFNSTKTKLLLHCILMYTPSCPLIRYTYIKTDAVYNNNPAIKPTLIKVIMFSFSKNS